MAKNGSTLKYRVQQLEKAMEKTADKEDVVEMKKDVKKIMTNHLPHIHEEIIKLNTSIKSWTAVNVGAVIIAIVLNRFI